MRSTERPSSLCLHLRIAHLLANVMSVENNFYRRWRHRNKRRMRQQKQENVC